MRLFLQDGPARLQILSRSHVRELRDLGAARELVRPLLSHPGNRAAARAALGAGTTWSDQELIEQLARRMVQEGLLLVSCADSWLSSIPAGGSQPQQQPPRNTPLQDEEAAKQGKPAPEPEQKHWLEIELLDDEGKPIANERYFVELPDGSKLSGRTDSQGRARAEDVDPGTAKVSFPDLDKKMYGPG
ncbi:MAG: hypothetical protein QOH06_5416 [Acidobacteriota bacterium]|jgi:hypothetical protein|nr:hypothetical protein [Acidobacteriota bacterium]